MSLTKLQAKHILFRPAENGQIQFADGLDVSVHGDLCACNMTVLIRLQKDSIFQARVQRALSSSASSAFSNQLKLSRFLIASCVQTNILSVFASGLVKCILYLYMKGQAQSQVSFL